VKHVRRADRKPQPVVVEGAVGVRKGSLITEGDGAPTVALRLFEIEPGGHTPWHAHDWEHVVYVVDGSGTLKTEDGDADFERGDALLVPPGAEHNFINRGEGRLSFLCIVPHKGDR
jgi:quercetin dioxygenase-like cupin family protein